METIILSGEIIVFCHREPRQKSGPFKIHVAIAMLPGKPPIVSQQAASLPNNDPFNPFFRIERITPIPSEGDAISYELSSTLEYDGGILKGKGTVRIDPADRSQTALAIAGEIPEYLCHRITAAPTA